MLFSLFESFPLPSFTNPCLLLCWVKQMNLALSTSTNALKFCKWLLSSQVKQSLLWFLEVQGCTALFRCSEEERQCEQHMSSNSLQTDWIPSHRRSVFTRYLFLHYYHTFRKQIACHTRQRKSNLYFHQKSQELNVINCVHIPPKINFSPKERRQTFSMQKTMSLVFFAGTLADGTNQAQ